MVGVLPPLVEAQDHADVPTFNLWFEDKVCRTLWGIPPLLRFPMFFRKKLIEVALPLEKINEASVREKSIRHGHPSTLHLWWARRPLATARAVLFAQMVDDPSACPEEFPSLEDQEQKRQALFKIIEELVLWENTGKPEVFQRAHDEIKKSWVRTCRDNADHPNAKELFDPERIPAFHDPFAGGGALPLEAQRLGLESHASDLNPVAVLINKAMIEIPPKFANCPPVNPIARENATNTGSWRGASGLAEDIQYYGQWMRDQAQKRIGHLYPKIKISEEMLLDRNDLAPYLGRELTVIAWLWARTVKSPNPAFSGIDVPLISTFMLSTKPGKEAYLEPVLEEGGYWFRVRIGEPDNEEKVKKGTSAGKRASFLCLMSNAPITYEYIRKEGKHGRMGSTLIAIVADGNHGRVYLPSTKEMEEIARSARPIDIPDAELPERALGFRVQEYGMVKWSSLFSPRQLVALTTFSDLVKEAQEKVREDYISQKITPPPSPLPLTGEGEQSTTKEKEQSLVVEPFSPLLSGGGAGGGVAFSEEKEQSTELAKHYGITRSAQVSAEKLNFARQMRKLPTGAEARAWEFLRDCRCQGLKFRRQQVIRGFIVDFYCAELRLAIELDGEVHAQQAEYDAARDAALALENITVLRVPNHEIGKIQEKITPPPNPLPLSGEGEQSTSKEEVQSLGVEPFSPLLSGGGAGGGVAFSEEKEQSLRAEPFSPLLSGGEAGGGVYSEAISIYLALTVSRCSAHWSQICTWDSSRESVRTTFARQAIPMTWDIAEANPMSNSSGNFTSMLDWVCKAVRTVPSKENGQASQSSAESQSISFRKVVSTDPPYYDNIGYADLSDFFYIWLRKSLKSIYPTLFSTMVVPKAQELISAPHRHGSQAESFFLEGMSKAIQNLAEQVHPAFPVTIYYAFKQTENKDTEGKVNTGWDTFLSAVVQAGFAITGTWPIRTELSNRSNGLGTNALASSIVLVCRVRPKEARSVSNLRFLRALQSELPAAMIPLQQANISPVDFAQAAIGPGMAVFSRNAKVIDAEEKEMSVREALARIDECLGELLSEQNSTLDSESRWALTWFEQHGFETGLYGAAETLSKARNTSIEKLIGAGMVESHSGKVRLFPQEELNPDWFPTEKVTTWRATHQLIRRLSVHGEESTAKLFAQLGDSVGNVPILSYRLFTLCESMKMAKEAVLYNDLVQRWIDIEKLTPHVGESKAQGSLSIGEKS